MYPIPDDVTENFLIRSKIQDLITITQIGVKPFVFILFIGKPILKIEIKHPARLIGVVLNNGIDAFHNDFPIGFKKTVIQEIA